MANRGTSVDGGWKLVSFGLCVFSGSFGIRSIVPCKCSGKVLIGYCGSGIFLQMLTGTLASCLPLTC